MTSPNSRSSRRDPARQRDRQQSRSRWLLPAGGLVIAAAAIIAVLVSQNGSTPGASPTASLVAAAPPTITGAALPKFTQPAGDAATGLTAPVVQGHDFKGGPVSIAPDGKPTLIIFAAHWCPHCQREIPSIQQWINAGRAPQDVDLVSVSTGADPTAPNYPPEAWFAREGWTVPVMVDPTNTVAQAFGLSGYPYFVVLDGQGRVVARAAGEIPISDLESLLVAVPRS